MADHELLILYYNQHKAHRDSSCDAARMLLDARKIFANEEEIDRKNVRWLQMCKDCHSSDCVRTVIHPASAIEETRTELRSIKSKISESYRVMTPHGLKTSVSKLA